MATINLYEQHGQFKKSVGYWIGRAGKRVERMWMLGSDRDAAERLASALVGQWAKIKKDFAKSQNGTGLKRPDVWTDLDVGAVCEFTGLSVEWTFADGGSFRRTPDNKYRTLSPTSPVKGFMDFATSQGYALTKRPASSSHKLADALDAYAEHVKGQAGGSHKYKVRIGQSIAAAKRYLTDLKHDGLALDQLDRQVLAKFTNHIKGRPVSDRTGERLSVATVKTVLQHLRQAIAWVDDHADGERFGGWHAPRKWDGLFDLDASAIRSKAERDAAADGPVQMTVAEFAAVYRAAEHDLHRAVLLAGLFFGAGQTELAVLRRNEIDLNAGTCTHRRNKTGQEGTFWVPPELVKLFRTLWKEPDADGLAFRTRLGNPLVSKTSDAVYQMWADLRERVGDDLGDGITFYSLRTLFGHRAMVAGGTDLRAAALSHAASDVGGKHYSNHRDVAAVAKVARALYADLRKAGTFRPVTD